MSRSYPSGVSKSRTECERKKNDAKLLKVLTFFLLMDKTLTKIFKVEEG